MRAQGRGVLVLTQHYDPEPNFVTADVAQALALHEPVTVITAHPNYPLGKFYPSTSYWRPTRTVEHGVVVWRLPFIPDHSPSIVRRALSYASFTVLATLFAPFVVRRPRLVWVYQTPFFVALASLWFRLFGAQVAYTCADLWPESFVAADVVRYGVILRLMFAYSRWINRFADLLICSTRSTVARYARDGVPLERLHYVPVWVGGIPEAYDPTAVVAKEDPIIVYAGNLGLAQDLETLVRAAATLVDRVPVTFHVYGTGASEAALRSLATELGASNLVFSGRVPAEEAFRISERALGQIVALRKTPLFRMTIPSKLFFCFATGTPILYALEGEAAELAQSVGAGIEYEAGNPLSLRQAIERLVATDVSERRIIRHQLRTLYAQEYDKQVLLARYQALLTSSTL